MRGSVQGSDYMATELHPFMYLRLLLGAVETKVQGSTNLQENTVLISMCLAQKRKMC